MRTKANDWFNPETGDVFYGIDVWVPINPNIPNAGGEWHHAAEGSKPLLFKTAAERDAKRKEVRRWTGNGLVKMRKTEAGTLAPVAEARTGTEEP